MYDFPKQIALELGLKLALHRLARRSHDPIAEIDTFERDIVAQLRNATPSDTFPPEQYLALVDEQVAVIRSACIKVRKEF